MRTGVAVLALLLLAGCGSTPVREPPAPLPAFQPVFGVRQVWSVNAGAATKDYVGLVPRTGDGVVYVAGSAGRVSAFDIESGKRKWQTDLEIAISGAVGLGDDKVAVGTRQGEVIVLARDTGERLWSAPVSSEVLGPPAIGDIVVAQTVDGRVFGLAAADGKRLWVYERTEPALSLRGTAAPRIVANAVLAGFASGKLVALDAKEGRLLWEATVSQPRGRNEIERLTDVDTPPLAFDDAIYAASYQGKLIAINPRSGDIIWSRDVSSYTGLASDGTNLYVTDERGHVQAFDRRTGASIWKQEALRGRRLNAPVVQDDFVVVADYEGYVHWLAGVDGRFMAREQAGSASVRAPAVAVGNILFVAGTDGNLSAFRLLRN